MAIRRLPNPAYLGFPFEVTVSGPRACTREAHVREQILQTLFTSPGERVFRPEFGAGVRQLVFEPNRAAIRELTRQRLIAALTPALQGEAEASSLEVEVTGEQETIEIFVSYRLATINKQEQHRFRMSVGGGGG